MVFIPKLGIGEVLDEKLSLLAQPGFGRIEALITDTMSVFISRSLLFS